MVLHRSIECTPFTGTWATRSTLNLRIARRVGNRRIAKPRILRCSCSGQAELLAQRCHSCIQRCHVHSWRLRRRRDWNSHREKVILWEEISLRLVFLAKRWYVNPLPADDQRGAEIALQSPLNWVRFGSRIPARISPRQPRRRIVAISEYGSPRSILKGAPA